MEKVLLHSCCGPCSLNCIEPLRKEGLEPVGFWYNPNIHPWKEYEARRNGFLDHSKAVDMTVLIQEEYGLQEFVKKVSSNLSNRCSYCYAVRLKTTAAYAKKHGFTKYTTTLLSSIYQDHEKIKKLGEEFAKQQGVEFLYRDFRTTFREKNQQAKELGLYMQKYCGCIFSEEERYEKQIQRDIKRFV